MNRDAGSATPPDRGAGDHPHKAPPAAYWRGWAALAIGQVLWRGGVVGAFGMLLVMEGT